MKNSLLIIVLFTSLQGFSQLVFHGEKKFQTFENHYAYFIDSTDHLSLSEVVKQDKFHIITTPSANFGRNLHVHWLRLPIKNPGDQPLTVYLQNSHPFVDNLAFSQMREGQVAQEARFGYQEKIKMNLVKRVARPTLQLTLLPGETALVYVKFQNTAGTLIFDIKLLSEDSFLNATLTEERIFNTLLGSMLAFSILALCFFIISRSKIYLYYSLYVLFLNVAIQCQTGRVYNFFDFMSDFLTGDSSFRYYGSLALLAHILFLKELFGQKPWKGAYRYLTLALIALGVVLNLLTFLDWGFIYYKINSVVNVYVLFFAVFLLNLLTQFHKRAFPLYLLSFAPMLLLLLYRILTNMNLLSTPVNFSYFTPPVIAIESLILLVGLSKSFIDNLMEKNRLEKQLKTSHIETQETERRKIAADLHDDLGSTLALLKDNIEKGDNSSKEIIQKAISDLRSISHQLMPQEFETAGFRASLEKFVTNQGTTPPVNVVFFGENPGLSRDTELNIYRVITELIHNARKHAKASEINIQLTYRPDVLHLAYEEAGNSLPQNAEGGLGLRSIHTRLQYLNARILENGNGPNGYNLVVEVAV